MSEVKTSHDVAYKVALNLNKSGMGREEAFDPTLILVIADLVFKLIEVMSDWCAQTPEQGFVLVQNPNLWHRLIVRKVVIDEMGRREFRLNKGQRIVDAIINTGKELSLEELRDLYKEV